MPNTENTYDLYRIHYIANEGHPDYPAQEELISSGFTKPQVCDLMKAFRNADDIAGEYFFVGNGEIITTEDDL